MIKIGYQGIEGSNAEQAAKDLVAKLKLEDVEYYPLTSSANVIQAMLDGITDYGVCAIYNSVAGIVQETVAATAGVELFVRGENTLNIHHCLFKKSADVPNESLKYVASHILAIKQCENHMRDKYPNLIPVEVEDTGLAARYLSDGTLSEEYAVLCRKNAGELFGLTLVDENIEDFKDNRTHFCLFELKNR